MERVKLTNPQKFDVGVRTLDKPNGINIKAGSFILATEDDIAYLASISNLLQKGILRIENSAESKSDVASEVASSVGIDIESPHFDSDEDIKKHLTATPKKIEEWLNTITEDFVFDRIYDIALTMDLTAARLAKLQAKMPDREFIV